MKDRTTSDTSQGPVAQMAEQRPCKSQVAGSIPGQGHQRALTDFYCKLEASQVPLEPEFQKVVDDHFWELIVKT